jgi:hypothetical protein
MNNKQEERKIMNYLRKIISNTYKYIRQACGFEDDVDVAPGNKLSREDVKIDSTDSTGVNKAMSQETTIKDETITARPKKPAARRKIAATRKKPIKKASRKSTKKPIKEAVKKT